MFLCIILSITRLSIYARLSALCVDHNLQQGVADLRMSQDTSLLAGSHCSHPCTAFRLSPVDPPS